MATDRKLATLTASTLVACSLPMPCFAAEYWEAYVGAERGIYVDTSSIQTLKAADHRSLTQITISLRFPMIGGSKIAYVAAEKEVDCKSRKSRDLSMTAYSEAGLVLLSSKRPSAWQTVGSGPNENLLIAVTCGSQSLPSDAVRFSDIKDARADYLVKSSMMILGK